MVGDIQAANGLLFVSYNGNNGGWSDTAGALEYVNGYAQNMNYITNEYLPWTTIAFVPYQFVIDLETRTVLGKDVTGDLMSADEILALVEENNL